MSGDPASFLTSAFGLTGQVAVVTGAARGLGRAIARGLAAAGAHVVAVDIDAGRLAGTVSELAAAGLTIEGRACDISSEDAVAALFEDIAATVGPVNVLVNNAAINEVAEPAESYPLPAWERAFRINLTAPFLCARAAASQMIAAGTGGSIINFSSINATTGNGRGTISYDVSKGGVNQLTRVLAVEWARYNIRVNAIQPCQFDPGWTVRLDDPDYSDLARTVLRGIPLGRFGQAEEMVGPVLFLASPAASMVTGVCLPVDGGNLAMNAGAGGAWSQHERAAGAPTQP